MTDTTTFRGRPTRIEVAEPQMLSFDPLPGAVERDDGIDRAEAGAAPIWRTVALRVIEGLARSRPELTSDDVWEVLESEHVDLSTPEPRAMGAVMRAAAREGWIVATDRVRPSERRVCHRRPERVWTSRLYRDRSWS